MKQSLCDTHDATRMEKGKRCYGNLGLCREIGHGNDSKFPFGAVIEGKAVTNR
jgi:hypothetical protein